MMKMIKQILAIPAEAAAIPPKPRMAAMIAITRNTHAYQSMQFLPSVLGRASPVPSCEYFPIKEEPSVSCGLTMVCPGPKKYGHLETA